MCATPRPWVAKVRRHWGGFAASFLSSRTPHAHYTHARTLNHTVHARARTPTRANTHTVLQNLHTPCRCPSHTPSTSHRSHKHTHTCTLTRVHAHHTITQTNTRTHKQGVPCERSHDEARASGDDRRSVAGQVISCPISETPVLCDRSRWLVGQRAAQCVYYPCAHAHAGVTKYVRWFNAQSSLAALRLARHAACSSRHSASIFSSTACTHLVDAQQLQKSAQPRYTHTHLQLLQSRKFVVVATVLERGSKKHNRFGAARRQVYHRLRHPSLANVARDNVKGSIGDSR